MPFLEIFPTYNIFAFDSRGFGQSSRKKGNKFLKKGDYGTNAYPDIQAAIDFVRSRSDKPVVLQGFCFGGAMAMYTAIKAKEHGRKGPDAIGVSCMFTKFENLFSRAFLVEDRWFYWVLMRLGLGTAILDKMMNGSLFELLPVNMVKKLDIPCWFDHPTQDKFAIMEEAVQVYNAAPRYKMFVQSELGAHVRMHAKVPYQYRLAYKEFLTKSGLITKEHAAE